MWSASYGNLSLVSYMPTWYCIILKVKLVSECMSTQTFDDIFNLLYFNISQELLLNGPIE